MCMHQCKQNKYSEEKQNLNGTPYCGIHRAHGEVRRNHTVVLERHLLLMTGERTPKAAPETSSIYPKSLKTGTQQC